MSFEHNFASVYSYYSLKKLKLDNYIIDIIYLVFFFTARKARESPYQEARFSFTITDYDFPLPSNNLTPANNNKQHMG